MKRIEIDIPELPHGHGLSFKKGVADGLLEGREYESTCHVTHSASYRKGVEIGSYLKANIAKLVKL